MKKKKSIDNTIIRLTALTIVLFALLLIPLNLAVQLHLQHSNQKKSADELFGQIEQLIDIKSKLGEEGISSMIGEMPFEIDGFLHIIDKNNLEIVASTETDMVRYKWKDNDGDYPVLTKNTSDAFHMRFNGKLFCVYQKEYGDYILMRTYDSMNNLMYIFKSSSLIFIYTFLGGIAVIAVLRYFINRKLIKDINAVVENLARLRQGEASSIDVKTDFDELEEILSCLNNMLNSKALSYDKLTYLSEKRGIPIGIFEEEYFYNHKYVNGKLYEILDIKVAEGMSDNDRFSIVKSTLNDIMSNPVDEEKGIYKYEASDRVKYLNVESKEDGQSIIYFISDVTLWCKEVDYATTQSQTDELTGIYNRRGFYDQMNKLFDEPNKLGHAAICIADADGLKRINDTFGHLMGDVYLKDIARFLVENSGNNAICSRLGGDEFAIFMYGFSNAEELKDFVSSFRKKKTSADSVAGIGGNRGAHFSLGVSYYPEEGKDYHDLMVEADRRMYAEKLAGRNSRK